MPKKKSAPEVTRILTLQVTIIDEDLTIDEIRKRLDVDNVRLVKEKVFSLEK